MEVEAGGERNAIWPKSGESRAFDPPLRADPDRPWLIKYGKHLRGIFDRLVAASSLIPNEPVLDVRDFPWTAVLRENWEAIREEARAAALGCRPAPPLAAISPDHRAIAPLSKWRSYFLWGYGYSIEENLAHCPVTSALVARVPGLNTAFFSILAPGTHIPEHRGVTKGLVTCHLGLVVPRDGDAKMRIGDRMVRWSEGETLIFDDTYRHEVWNESGGNRVVLVIQFRRPLRQPGRWFVDALLKVLRRSAFVQEARANVMRWNSATRTMDSA